LFRPPRAVVRRDAGLYTLERTLHRRGFARVGGADEAGRGACAGPLVTAAVVLPPGRRGEVPGLADSKLLTPAARERAYDEVVRRAESYAIVVIPAAELDARGLHRCNVEGLRRALGQLSPRPDYVLTDGFRVDGTGTPALAVWKGDRVSACIAAASVLAKVTRDRIMTELHELYPLYDFAQHKGYATPVHAAALARHGPCAQHRMSYSNVAAALAVAGCPADQSLADELVQDDLVADVLPVDAPADGAVPEDELRGGRASGAVPAVACGAPRGAGAAPTIAVRDNGLVEDVTA
jgi:ribonuclease HII